MKGKSCEDYSALVKRAAGYVYGTLMNHYLGNGSIVLVGEGPEGIDLKFAATDRWLETNQPANFGVTKEDSDEFTAHVEGCQSQKCREAYQRLRKVTPLFSTGRLLEKNGEGIALMSVFQGRGYRDELRLKRENGCGDIIDEIKPFLEWYVDDKDFWKWPE